MAAVLLVAAAGAAISLGAHRFLVPAEGLPAGLITDVARRGPLEISVVERGNLESAANVTLTSKVEGTTTIISIVEEGAAASTGDILVELDSSKFRNEATQQRILLEQAESALRQAQEALAIQKTQTESDIAAAQLKLDLALLDLDKYKLGESVQELNTVQGEITLAKEDLTRAREKYEFTRRLSKKGYATQSELEADRIAVTKAEIALRVADEKKSVIEKYTYKRMLAEKEANAREGDRELERVRRKANAALAQAEADLKARQLTAEVERDKQRRLLDQIEACKIRAPQDGLVVYANERSSRGSQEVVIQEGAVVRERQAIIHLPDVTRMRVNTRIHESKIDLIRSGLPALIRVDARPGESFHGTVDMVSLVPLSNNWPNPDLKQYATTVALTDGVDKVSTLKPGLTAQVEILIDRLADVLQIPLQAIVERAGQQFLFVVHDGAIQRRLVKAGKNDDMKIEIHDGVAEGETVVLNPRTALVDHMRQLEREFPVTDEASAGSTFQGVITPPAPSAEAARPGPLAKAKSAGGPPNPVAMFKAMDANGDGTLTPDEVPERMRDRFDSLDTSGDKLIDMTEWATAAARFGRRNRDGAGPPAPNGAAPGAAGAGAGAAR